MKKEEQKIEKYLKVVNARLVPGQKTILLSDILAGVFPWEPAFDRKLL